MMTTPDQDPADRLVDASGAPMRGRDVRCPRCGGSDRVASAGFGRRVRDICGQCGHDFGPRPIRVERDR